MPLYLTKSRFKLACSCPTKLFYQSFKDIYPNINEDNDFLETLAEGGYQVGKLAEFKIPGGTNIDTLKTDVALRLTNEELKKESCIIYEAAFVFENLLVRTDVLVKTGNHIKVYEVKAKSYSKGEDDQFINKNGNIVSAWKPYIYDIAFQKYVVSNALPEYKVSAYLMLIDKEHTCTLEGMQQRFKIVREITNDTNDAGDIFKRRKYIQVKSGTSAIDLDTDILISVNVDSVIEKIINDEEKIDFYNSELNSLGFAEQINSLAAAYNKEQKIVAQITPRCKHCEFNITSDKLQGGKKSGRWQCLQKAWELKEEDKTKALIFDLAGGFKSKDLFKTLIDQKKYFLKDIKREDLLTGTDKTNLKKGSKSFLMNIFQQLIEGLLKQNLKQIKSKNLN